MTPKWRFILIVSLLGNLTIAYVAMKAWEYRSHINEFRDLYLQVNEEYSQRGVYAESDRALHSDTTVPGRVVFFGTQVIKEWDLAASFAGMEPVNRGIAGQRAAGFLLRFRPDVVDLSPQAVVIEFSSYNLRPNMSIDEANDYAASLADLAFANGITPVLTTMIPPVADFEVFEHPEYKTVDSVAIYNERVKQFASDKGYLLADWCGVLADSSGALDPSLAGDRVEPNELGYRRLAEETARVLRQAGIGSAR